MFGVHHGLGVFVAVDPRMHSPTWFSRSVEMKEDALVEAKQSGWHAWERERLEGRRVLELSRENLQTEALIAFTPELFLRYVAFERIASGIDTGERMLMAEQAFGAPAVTTTKHPLEVTLGLSATEILDVLGDSFRLLVAVRGSVAEHHLGKVLKDAPGVTDVERIDKDGEPDFRLRFSKRDFRIECKNVLRKMAKANIPRVDFQKTRATPGNRCSRYYTATQFELLAACLHPVSERWEYRFCDTRLLDPHPSCDGRLSPRVDVAGGKWSEQVSEALDRLVSRRS